MAVNREGLPRIGALQATYVQVRGQVRQVMRDFLEFIQLLHETCLNEADFQRVINTPISLSLIALTDREVTKVRMTYKGSSITKMLMAFPGWAEDSQEGWVRNGIRLNELMLVEIIAMMMVVGTDRFQQGPNKIAEAMTQTGQGRQELRATARQRTTLLMYMRPKAMKYLLGARFSERDFTTHRSQILAAMVTLAERLGETADPGRHDQVLRSAHVEGVIHDLRHEKARVLRLDLARTSLPGT